MNTYRMLLAILSLGMSASLAVGQDDSLRLRGEASTMSGAIRALHAEGLTWQDSTSKVEATYGWDEVQELSFGVRRSIAFGNAGEKVVGRVVGVSGGRLQIEGSLLGHLALLLSDLPRRPLPPKPMVPSKKTPLTPTEWNGRVAIGSTFAAGNRDVLSGKIDALLQRDFRYDHIEVKLSAIYGKASGVVSNNSQTLGARYKHYFNDDLYGFVGAEVARDPVKSLEMRGLLNLGCGWSLWDGGKGRSLNVEAGAGFRHEGLGDETRSDGTARAAVFWNEIFFDDVTLKQKLEGIVPVGDFASWLGRSETVVIVPLNENWSFRTSLKMDYQAAPATGKDPVDILATTGLEFRF